MTYVAPIVVGLPDGSFFIGGVAVVDNNQAASPTVVSWGKVWPETEAPSEGG